MKNDDFIVDAVRSKDDRAGVFEYDGETCYFYLCDVAGAKPNKVISAIRLLAGTPDFQEDEIVVRWDTNETKVGLFIRDQLWAAFDAINGTKYGGGYRPGMTPNFPPEVGNAFNAR